MPIFGAQVHVSVPRGQKAEPLLRARTVAGAAVRVSPTVSLIDPPAAAALATEALAPDAARSIGEPALVYFPTAGKKLAPAWQMTLQTQQPFGEWLLVLDAETGEVLHRQELLHFDSGQVFESNPGAANGGTAPAPDCDTPAREQQQAQTYVQHELQGIAPGESRLRGEFVDLTAPGIDSDFDFDGTGGDYKAAGLANEPSRIYVYPCNDDRFEEVMAYYHIDTAQRRIRSLGFHGPSGIMDRPIPVHAHFLPICNAFFSALNRSLHFGDFDDPLTCPPGIPAADAAEDADVIVHEYGHAIQDDQVPFWGIGPLSEIEQAISIGEGFSDFFAAAILGDPCMGEYVNFGRSECGGKSGLRWLQNSRSFPAGFTSCPDIDLNQDGFPETEEPHCGGQLWGAALWDLAENLGGGSATPASRDLALQLVLEGHFFLDAYATFNEAAAATCKADELLYEGAHKLLIGQTFAARGIIAGACVTDDEASAYLNIRHPYSGDLDISLLVGRDPAAPVCELNLADPTPLLFLPDVYVGTIPLDGSNPCTSFLPPLPDQPWWLGIQDVASADFGYVAAFEISLEGGTRCVSPDTPLAVPDGGPVVYAAIDCTVTVGPLAGTPLPASPTPTPQPSTPGPSPTVEPYLSGDVDCNRQATAVDALLILRFLARMEVAQHEPCPDIGQSVLSAVQDISLLSGDVDCSGTVDPVDALLILRYLASLPLDLPEGCEPIAGGQPPPSPVPPPATPKPRPSPGLPPVHTRNSSLRIVGNGLMAVVDGEVFNGLPRPIGLVRIKAEFYSASGDVKTAFGYACVGALPPGSDSPYEISLFRPPADTGEVVLSVASYVDPPFVPPADGLTAAITNNYLDAAGFLHVDGNITNSGATAYRLVKACLALYNSEGLVVGTRFAYTTPGILEPGQTGSFSLTFKPDTTDIDAIRAWPDGLPH